MLRRPVRTCVGCRVRADRSDLLRVVAVRGGTTVVVTPDLSGSAPGRGAHLHRDQACLQLAVRRKAFGRALRVAEPVDPTPLVDLLTGATSQMHAAPPRSGA
ncbi:hypothetical protein CLV56_0480 [Mumia flava]|uniref:YlxR domain-containing protein n=1 Tax=Mumia flava TaxID=1348852 RepID=A0A0B2BGN9_9ACTN|nr:YlxR family protein [Mumia flava]PJJ56275.1 hypothetical protein CLV56_0480 [Mumia flava]